MSGGRWVVLGVAHTRSPWFTEVARWSTMGSIPVEFVKCLSVDELRARLRTGRRHSAALVDATLPVVDRDLLAELRSHGCTPVVVDAPGRSADWTELGAAALLPSRFGPEVLVDALEDHARPVGAVELDDPTAPSAPGPAGADAPFEARPIAPLIAVLGPGGAGASTVAAALAQGLAARRSLQAPVVLVDGARRAHLALLHDAGDIVPGICEMAEAHRHGRPTPALAIELTYDVPARDYRLLLGLRRPGDWTLLRRPSLLATFSTLRRASSAVVVDTDPDLDGERTTGSFDIEDLHLLARTAASLADLVVLVTLPTVTGLHAVPSLLRDLHEHGVEPERTVIVVNRAPLRPAARAEVVRTIAELSELIHPDRPPHGPVFVPVRRAVDEIHRAVSAFPSSMVDPPTGAVLRLLTELGPRHPVGGEGPGDDPEPISPGQLGAWSDDASDGPGWTTPNVPQHP